MSILGFLFKSKKEMAKEDTKRVKVGKYTITSHAQNRTVDATRKLTKKDMLINLLSKSSKNSNYYIHMDGTEQYDRVNDNNKTVTRITKEDNHVKTIQKYHNSKRSKKYAHRNFKGGN